MKSCHWGVGLSLCGVLVLIGCGETQKPAGDESGSSTSAAATEKVNNTADAGDTAPAANGAEAEEAAETTVVIKPGEDAYKEAQEALFYAEDGDVIEFAEGEFDFNKALSMDDKKNITIRGQGMDKTILKFAEQQKGTGAEGIMIKNVENFTIEDLTLQDTLGDAIKVEDANGLVIRRIKTWWSNGPDAENGAYGVYPVLSENVLVEECVAECASDAGIYVGQSKNIIVRRCRAERNVAGIEIENCIGADVYENEATNNTGGLLVFSLPGLVLKNGSKCRVYNNKIHGNNHDNFASPGNMVATVPPGTGLSIMANDKVEVFDNVVSDHKSTNCYIISFFTTQRKFEDAEYDPYPEAIAIYNNKFEKGGYDPQKAWASVVAFLPENKLPDITYDGVVDEKKLVDGQLPEGHQIYIGDNGEFTFANIDFGSMMAEKEPKPSFDLAPYSKELPKLEPISIPGVE